MKHPRKSNFVLSLYEDNHGLCKHGETAVTEEEKRKGNMRIRSLMIRSSAKPEISVLPANHLTRDRIEQIQYLIRQCLYGLRLFPKGSHRRVGMTRNHHLPLSATQLVSPICKTPHPRLSFTGPDCTLYRMLFVGKANNCGPFDRTSARLN